MRLEALLPSFDFERRRVGPSAARDYRGNVSDDDWTVLGTGPVASYSQLGGGSVVD